MNCFPAAWKAKHNCLPPEHVTHPKRGKKKDKKIVPRPRASPIGGKQAVNDIARARHIQSTCLPSKGAN